jgi:hypothetical protein
MDRVIPRTHCEPITRRQSRADEPHIKTNGPIGHSRIPVGPGPHWDIRILRKEMNMFSPFMRGASGRSKSTSRSKKAKGGRIAVRRAVDPALLDLLETRQLLSFTITPTFDSTITSDPNAATIENTINTAIASYQSSFSDNINVNITFQEMTTGLGASSTQVVTVSFKDYLDKLTAHETTADDNTAVPTIGAGPNNPVNGDSNIKIRQANARALGFSVSGGTDSTIGLNTSICNLSRTGTQDNTKYDLMAVACHEIDEALAFGTALNNLNNGDPSPTTIESDDLYRYSAAGTRSYDTALATNSYFSIDGGTTNLSRFNQKQGGDFSDWFSTGAHTPQIQDAFGTQGSTPNLVVELRRLDVLGYSRVANVTPAATAAADQSAIENTSKAIDLGSFADSDTGPWNVNVSWGDGTPDANFFVGTAGTLGTMNHTYVEEGNYAPKVTITDFTGLTDSKSFNVNVSDPAVIATGAFTVTAVEGASSGSQTVATFTDPAGAESTANYSATVDWGDGSTSTGIISQSGGVFTVKGTHTYAEESAADHPNSNPYDITVTIAHESAPTTTVHSSATVSDPAVVANAVAVTAVEGQAFTAKPVATFTDPGGAEPTTDYSATIDWGDGATTPGTITFAGGVYTVTGDHTYAEESAGHTVSGKYPIVVTITHETAPTTTVNTTADVSDPAVLAAGGFTFTAVEGMPSGTQTVATFIDPGGAEDLADYAALINWGDGVTSPGTISFAGGVYTVTGDHTYATGLGNPADFGNSLCDATPPKYHKAITVTISHENAPTATAISDATISIAPGTAHSSSDGSLIVVGTTGDDKIHFTPVGNQPRTVNVFLGSTSLGVFTVGANGRIVVAALAGDDDVQLAGAISVDTALYGGPGNDRLNGGGGRNIEIGCEGDDQLNSGKLGDLLVGGLGSDRIIGGSGDDILVAGMIVDGANVEDDQYADLVGILSDGQITLPFHAADDGAIDRLTGAAGVDTAYYNYVGSGVRDIFTDKAESAFDI